MKASRPDTVDDYIKSVPAAQQKRLKQLRAVVKKAAPAAVESISYGMPGYKLEGRPLVYFAAAKSHIGFYALPTGHAKFKADLAAYKQGKGSVQFPDDEPLPLELIARLVQFRVQENLAQAAAKGKVSAVGPSTRLKRSRDSRSAR